MTAQRLLPLICATFTAAVTLTGCSGQRAGDVLARDVAAQQAAELKDDLGHRTRVRDAEHIVATEITAEQTEGAGWTARATPLGWPGRTTGSQQATIDVRFVVNVPAQTGTFSDPGSSAGQATRCYRYLIQLYRYTSHSEIDCPTTTASPVVPSASPIPRLPADATQRLTAVLRTATPDSLATAAQVAFPEKHIVVDTAVRYGALIATVGVPAERDCLLLVRTSDGTIESPAYDRIQLEPGETGCSTSLFTSPPR